MATRPTPEPDSESGQETPGVSTPEYMDPNSDSESSDDPDLVEMISAGDERDALGRRLPLQRRQMRDYVPPQPPSSDSEVDSSSESDVDSGRGSSDYITDDENSS